MAYMHELVHIGNLSSPFLTTSPFTKGYPSIFVFEGIKNDDRCQERLNLCTENIPNDKKWQKNFD